MPAWSASWISFAYDPRQDLGVFAFRRTFQAKGGGDARIRVSADNRYKLFCNGRLVGLGPQRGDERHWFFETYDLAPFLTDGANELLALVWNFGWMAPMAQHTVRTAFVCEVVSPPQSSLAIRGGEESLSTPGKWEVARVPGWDFDMMHNGVGEFYIDVGPGEIIQGGIGVSPMVSTGVPPVSEGRDLYLDVANLNWRDPHVICHAEDRGSNGGGTPWMLIPATLPPQRYSPSPRVPSCRGEGAGGWGKRLLDFGELTCAYPRIRAAGPAGTELRVTYAESLWVPGTNEKGNRNETEGKEIRGYQDRFILSGGEDVFEPLWWRTFRFVEIEAFPSSPREEGLGVEGAVGYRSEGSTLHPPAPSSPWEEGEVRIDFQAFETGYPYAVESSFEADDPWVRPIWDVAVRTVQRCAGETYFDCPYYEQLQYVGDSRIQALIGYYLGRDRRLQRNCIDQIGWSIMENGLTQSRYPSRQTQVIPPFSLWWVMMWFDQWLYDSHEPAEAHNLLHPHEVLGHWTDYNAREPLRPSHHPFWHFWDWFPEWPSGVPKSGQRHAIEQATYMMAVCATWLKSGINEVHLYEKSIGNGLRHLGDLLLWKVDDAKPEFSEHLEALYRCNQSMCSLPVDPWPTEALAAANAAKCTYYFSYYKHLAMFGRLVEEGSYPFDYFQELQPWKEQLERGLTTFAENPEPTRSDCHAWSAHPILGFFQIVAGVTSIAPGWKKAKIMPHPGNLRRFDARIAHPDGQLQVKFEDGRFEIDSPVPFELAWHGKRETFTAGRHRVS